MGPVNNASVIRAGKGLCAILPVDFLLQQCQKCLCYTALNQQIVRRNTRLASIGPLAPHDTSGTGGQIGVAVDNTRALTAKFQCYRGQVFSCGLHDDFADSVATGIKNMVER